MSFFSRIQAKLARYSVWDDQQSLRFLSAILFRPIQRETIQRILIYRVGNIGDTVVAMPAIAAVREQCPTAHITLLTSAGIPGLPGAADVLAAFPGLVSQVISYPPEIFKLGALQNRNALNTLRQELQGQGHIDLWISLPVTMQTFNRSVREMLFARWLGCRSALGFTVLLPEHFRTFYVRFYSELIPRTSDWLLALIAQGLSVKKNPTGPLATAFSPPPKIQSWFQQPPNYPLERFGLNPNAPVLVVNAGAKLALKQWPPAFFQETLIALQAEFPQLQIALLGNEEEVQLNQKLASALSGPVANLSGQLNLTETWALLSQVTAVLSNDTGTMHMAGLLEKPVFTPMSGQFPAPLWHPPGPSLVEFRRSVPCAPCFETECPLSDQICMTLLTPERIISSIKGQLSKLLPP